MRSWTTTEKRRTAALDAVLSFFLIAVSCALGPRRALAQNMNGTAWNTLKIGAGGFIRGLDIAPDGTMVARTDTYGAYLWNGTQWVQLVTAASMPAGLVSANVDTGNTGQGVYEIQVASSNTQILYMTYDGYVFKSTNQGTTWTQTSFAQVAANPNDGYAQEGQKMAVDPNNPNIVYAGTPQNGLFATSDGGATWHSVGAVPASQATGGQYPGITGILFDPVLHGVNGQGNTNTIFAASYGNGVYVSTDAGVTWSLTSAGPTNVINAAVSPNGAYCATDGTNLWIYAGGAWTEQTPATTGDSYNIQAIAVNPSNPNEIALIASAGYLDISFDGGSTWSGLDWASNNVNSTDIPWLTAANEAVSGNYLDIGGVVFNPLAPNQIIASAGTGVWNAPNPSSSFAGSNYPETSVTWTDQSVGIEQLVANEIISPPGGTPILASWDRPFFQATNPNAYPSTYGPVDSVAINPGWSTDYASSSAPFIVGLTANASAYYSTNGGQTWSGFPNYPSFVGSANGGTIAASTPQNIIVAPGDGVQPYYTTDQGQTWNAVTLPGVSNWSDFGGVYYLDERSVTADRVLANTFYLYYPGNGLYKTTNGGASWTQFYNAVSSGDITPFDWFNDELMSVPGEAGNLFFTGGQQGTAQPDVQEPFMRSTNGGQKWTAVPNVLEVTTFGFGAPATNGAYPSIYIAGWVNDVYGVFRSTDNAQDWTQISVYPNNSLDSIKTVSGDMNTYGTVYVGFQGSGYVYGTVAQSAPSITSSSSASGMAGSAFSYQIQATNAPSSYGATGLPSGLSVNASNGLISGTPVSSATASVSLSASNAQGTGTATLALIISSVPTLSASFIAPVSGSTETGTILLTASTSGGAGTAWVQFKLDNVALGSQLSASPYSYSWNTTNTPNGAHVLMALAQDILGNQATSTPVPIVVRNAQTYVHLIGDPDGAPDDLFFVKIATALEPTFPIGRSSISLGLTLPASGSKTLTLAPWPQDPTVYYDKIATNSVAWMDLFDIQNATFTLALGTQTFYAMGEAGTIEPSMGGVASDSTTDPSGSAKITIMPGQISQEAQVLIDPPPSDVGGIRAGALAKQNLKSLGMGRDIVWSSSGTLNTATLVLPFNPASIPLGLSDAEVHIAYFNTVTNTWQLIGNAVIGENSVSASVTHFSIYMPVFALPSTTAGLIGAYAFPNPATSGNDPTIRVCLGVVDNVSVTIFDVSGRVVNSGTVSQAPALLSGTTNSPCTGQYVYDYVWSGSKASGIYFAVIHGHSGGSTVKAQVKFAVVR